MAAWTEETKAQVVEMYEKAEPTPETSTEIIKDIAEEMDASPNGVRMILVQAGVYVKKEAGAPAGAKGGKSSTGSGEGTKRVSKESQIAALKAAIENIGGPVDNEILDKLTGKAAAYFVTVLESK
jgi:transposase-like protein